MDYVDKTDLVGSCYRLITNKGVMRYEYARNLCWNDGAELLVIDNEVERDVVARMLAEVPPTWTFYTDFTRESGGTYWVGNTYFTKYLFVTSHAGAAAENAELLKYNKYRGLGREYNFVPFGVETLGPWGPSAHKLFAEIAKHLVDVTGDRRAGGFLAQRISIAIQRGNAASILGTMPRGPFLDLGESIDEVGYAPWQENKREAGFNENTCIIVNASNGMYTESWMWDYYALQSYPFCEMRISKPPPY